MAKSVILKSLFIAYVVLISLVSLSRCDLSTKPNITGFTIDLIHRDSPQSPYYDPSLSPTQRLVNALRRSHNYVQRFNKTHVEQAPEADIVRATAEYLLKYSIGTPPVPSLGIVDTGSLLLWTQCRPCVECFKQNLTLFWPRKSSTYVRLPCTSPYCNLIQPKTTCATKTNTCLYSVFYGDGSFSRGTLSTDILTLTAHGGSTTAVPNFLFGCGHANRELSNNGESGVVGLGNGRVSLVNQLGLYSKSKFSYCLVPQSNKLQSTSRLNFGILADVWGIGVVSTPLVRRGPYYFYFVTLKGINVGNERLEETVVEEGNIVVDSGSTLTWLPRDFYDMLKTALLRQVKLKQIKDPTGELDLCFYTRQDDVQMPKIAFHFDGADMNLKQENMFVRTSDTSYCLASLPARDRALLGNIAQADFLMGFDVENEMLHIKPTYCTDVS